MVEQIKFSEYDLIVVGAGITGATVAYIAAHDYQQKVLVLEKEESVGGLLEDYIEPETSLLVQKHGTHFLHTNNENVFKFLTDIVDWVPYILRAKTHLRGKAFSLPFNYATIDGLYEKSVADCLKRKIAETFNYEPCIPLIELLRSDDKDISGFAKILLNEHFILLESKKRNVSKDKLNGKVMMGHYFHLSYEDQCYRDRYQMLPKKGFSFLIKEMLKDTNITLNLGIDFTKYITISKDKQNKLSMYSNGEKIKTPVVYTGGLDYLFDKCYGELPYYKMTLKESIEESFQSDCPCLNYPEGKEYTAANNALFLYQNKTIDNNLSKSVITYEYYDENGSQKSFPKVSKSSSRKYIKYKKMADKTDGLFYCGRLGRYQYLTISDAIQNAMDIFGKIKFKEISLMPNYVDYRRPMEKLLEHENNFKKTEHIGSKLLIGDLDREIPEITVIIPTYNRVKSLEQTINSVLRQDISNDRYDILIVDNDPTIDNETYDLIKKYVNDGVENIYYYKNEKNLGAYGNMNRAIKLVRTKWISMVHDDDIVFSNAVRWALNSISEINDRKLAMILPRQLQVFSDEQLKRRAREKGVYRSKSTADKYDNPKFRWRLHGKLYDATKRRFWRISKFDCYMVPFLYPAPSYGTVINKHAIIDVGGYSEGYPTDDNLCCVKLSEKYHCYLCGESWGLYSFHTADVMKPRSSLQFVDATLQYRLYMEKNNLLCKIVGKFIRESAYIDAVEGDVMFGRFKRGYATGEHNYKYYDEYSATEKQKKWSRRIQKCWETWIMMRSYMFGKKITNDFIKKCNGEHY